MLKFYQIKYAFYLLLCLGIGWTTFTFYAENQLPPKSEFTSQELWELELKRKTDRREKGYAKFNGPDKFQEFHAGIRTRESELSPSYPANYRLSELAKAQSNSEKFRARGQYRTQNNGVITFKERGPSNTPGRTRALLVMPQDPTHSTWLAGSSGGGIWKTTNKGQSWTNKSPNFPTLAVATLAMSTSNPSVIYAGTGEYIASSGTAINGDGIFKSLDGGDTWQHLASTANNANFVSITRIIVDPNNPNLVLACSAPNTWATGANRFRTTIMRSIDGGTSWTTVFEAQSGGAIEQLVADPLDFSIQYAARNGVGVYKSTDAGATWQISNVGMSPSGRVEIAISPSKNDRLYASTVGNVNGAAADLYMSDNAGATWNLVDIRFNSEAFDFLGGQGWYDNTIAVDPFNPNKIYFGGVDLFRAEITGTTGTPQTQYNILENNTANFMTLVNFGAVAYGGRLSVGPDAGNAKVELRFGPGLTQKAHRYLVPEGATSGVSDANYSYQDYVDVPFQAWDVTNNVQLNIAFRDQDRNGQYNLLTQNTDGSALEQSREYLYISNTPYNANTPNPNMAVVGGHVFQNKYFVWPVATPGTVWNPTTLPSAKLEITPVTLTKISANTLPIVDVYGRFNSRNRFITISQDVHPDMHNLIMVPTNVSLKTFFVILTTDGGVFYSNPDSNPGTEQGTWNYAGNGYNTGQFYGADKRPGRDEYFGGLQDNGTWQSPLGVAANETSAYNFRIGGDGFEVIWNNDNDQWLIGGSQNNNFRRSINGGNTWQVATSGLSGQSPFISKLSNSKYNPNVIFTVTSAGVFRSVDFGESWALRPITENWGASTFLDVKVSRANANIVWAGSGMVNTGNRRNLYVSVDGGNTFQMTNNYTEVPLGSISRLSTHPTEHQTAYALFSFGRGPKVLRTTDLGQTWEDISGFGTNNVSSNGFPDVAVYTLYVRPDNPNIIWVGTEIGIVESLDNGASWALLEGFPNASVWDMKGIDNQIVIATHGRGIWTAEVDADQFHIKLPTFLTHGTAPNGQFLIDYEIQEEFDSVRLLINGSIVSTVRNLEKGIIELAISNQAAGNKEVKMIGYIDGAPFHSKTSSIQFRGIGTVTEKFFTDFNAAAGINAFNGTGLGATFLSPFQGRLMQSAHPYPLNRQLITVLEVPIRVSGTYPLIQYQDMALLATGDSVFVEASLDGRNWVTLDKYNSNRSSTWQSLLTSNTSPTQLNQFEWQMIDLSDFFNPNDVILLRWRLSSVSGSNAWGWAINELYVQVEPLSTEIPSLAKAFTLYPNPAVSKTTLQVEILKNQPVEIWVADAYGKQVLRTNTRLDDNGASELPTHSLRPGTYLVTVRSMDQRKFVKKLVVMK